MNNCAVRALIGQGAKCTVSIALLLAALALHSVALAQTHKCVGQDGRTTYSSIPCAQGDQAKTLDIQSKAPPPSPKAELEATRQKERQAFEAYEAKRQQKLAQSRANDKAVEDAAARVRQMKTENYDPKKCAAARARAQSIQRADPLMAPLNVDFFDANQKAQLYCGP